MADPEFLSDSAERLLKILNSRPFDPKALASTSQEIAVYEALSQWWDHAGKKPSKHLLSALRQDLQGIGFESGLTDESLTAAWRRFVTRFDLASDELMTDSESILADCPSPTVKSESEVASPTRNWIPLTVWQGEKLEAIRFWDGSEQPLEKQNQILTRVVEKLYADNRLSVQNLPLQWPRHKRYCVHIEPVHPSGKRFENSHRIDGYPPLFVETKLPRAQTRGNTIELVKFCNIDPVRVLLQVR